MGSPYEFSRVSRVSVVRKLGGLQRALKVVGSFGSNKEDVRLIVDYLFDRVCYIHEINDGVWSDRAIEGFLGCVYDLDDTFDNITGVLIEICTTFLIASREKSRLALMVGARYEWEGSENFNSVLVFDLTRKDGSLSSEGALSIASGIPPEGQR